ncbi:MAG: sigma-E factor negative regulatory protein [Ectothiorhodospiraceae bacterium]|nr:sigma-E factor negative regulatory protein [Ectothiorhodospiraceae bacterium]
MTRGYDEAERVSALVDGELQGGELQALLSKAKADEELKLRLERYALIRDALHRNLPEQVVADGSLAHRVSRALEAEPAHSPAPRADDRAATPAPRSRRWMAPFAGMAMAASVAVVAVMIWPDDERPAGASGPAVMVDSSAQPRVQGIQTVSTESIRWDRLDPDVQARLDGYAISHDEQAATRQVGIMPRHVRITSHGAAGQ